MAGLAGVALLAGLGHGASASGASASGVPPPRRPRPLSGPFPRSVSLTAGPGRPERGRPQDRVSRRFA